MTDRDHGLPLIRQAALLGLSRGCLYYEHKAVSDADLTLMRSIDALHLDYPFAGARMLRDLLRARGLSVGRRHVASLMRLMGVQALYRTKVTTRRNVEHPVFPYLLRKLVIERPNHVWCADITYIPMRRGFLYLCAVMDWSTRRILSWRLSNTLSTDFCIDAVQEAIARFGKPEIFNTDQGCQFTDHAFVELITKIHGIKLSMDGKGAWRDNVFLERFWKTLKYEEVYLHAYETVSEARASIGRHIDFYNSARPHTSLGRRTPDVVYFTPAADAAA